MDSPSIQQQNCSVNCKYSSKQQMYSNGWKQDFIWKHVLGIYQVYFLHMHSIYLVYIWYIPWENYLSWGFQMLFFRLLVTVYWIMISSGILKLQSPAYKHLYKGTLWQGELRHGYEGKFIPRHMRLSHTEAVQHGHVGPSSGSSSQALCSPSSRTS